MSTLGLAHCLSPTKVVYFLLSFFFIAHSFASTGKTHNIYNANGYLIAECNKTCRYLVYDGLSNVGIVENSNYEHYLAGPTGKIAQINQTPSNDSTTVLTVADFHQTITAVVDTEGKTEQRIYDAFGVLLASTGNTGVEVDSVYTDHHALQSAEGLFNAKARFYDPSIGRFIITDPIDNGLNWYRYANNNPLSFVDPTGQSFNEKEATENKI